MEYGPTLSDIRKKMPSSRQSAKKRDARCIYVYEVLVAGQWRPA